MFAEQHSGVLKSPAQFSNNSQLWFQQVRFKSGCLQNEFDVLTSDSLSSNWRSVEIKRIKNVVTCALVGFVLISST
jgi:hypothetical protein